MKIQEKIIILIFLGLLLFSGAIFGRLLSCNKTRIKKKRYQYIEIAQKGKVFQTQGIIESEPEIIKAINDSAAYIDAYDRFSATVLIHTSLDENGRLSKFSFPIGFKLIDANGNDISKSIKFNSKDSLEYEIREKHQIEK